MRRDRLRLTIYTAAALLAAVGGLGIASAGTRPGVGTTATELTVAPYVDMGLSGRPRLAEFAKDAGVKGFTLAFVNSAGGCKASWFGAFDPRQGQFRDE